MEKINATFHFTEKYEHTNFSKQEATVTLYVDYKQNQFSITPGFSGGDKFRFCQSSRDYKKWLAVINCIQRAIEFGNIEIGVIPRARGVV